MKKSLSIVLSLLMVFSCISFLFTGSFTVYAAAGENHTVSTSVEKQNGLYGGVITSNATQTVAYGDSATVTADPFYGNGFLGWYDGDNKVSSNLSYTFVVQDDVTLTAKFDIRNLVENGNMEAVSAQQSTVDAYNNGPSYSAKNRGTAAVISTSELTNTNSKFGNYALKLTPAAGSESAKQKSLICIPITVEKNTDYIWRFSYKVDETPSVAFSSNVHCLDFSLNSAVSDWTNAQSGIKYTIHSQPYDVTGAVNTNVWGWEGGAAFTQKNSSDNGRNTAKQWQDVYILFNTGTDSKIFANGDTGTMYLMLGSYATTCVDDTYIDNMSVSKAVANDASVITATAGGTVTAQEYRCQENYYVYTTYARGNANVYTGRDTSKVYYPSIYERWTANAEAGSTFQGWYDGDTLISKDFTAPLLMTGKTYTAKFGQAASASDGGCITENADGTFTAKAFYGNSFVGWYTDETATTLVTTDATVDPNNSSAKYAKFTTENQIYDGDFETGNAATDSYWQNLPHYAPATPAPTYQVTANPIKGSGAAFGDKVLMITPTQLISGQSGANDKLKNLLNYPVEVEGGKTYMWRFSYAFLASGYDANVMYLNFSIDKWQAKGTPEWSQGLVPVSYHSQAVNYTKDNENDILDNISDAVWSWGKVTATSYNTNKQASGANEWIDIYIIFTPEEDQKLFLSLGTVQSIVDPLYFDNMSFTEVTSTKPNVIAGENGSVTANTTATIPAFEATADRGIANPLSASIDATKPLYANMYLSYFAKADAGYIFDGWYKDGVRVSSEKELRVLATDGGEYKANFIYDPTRYYLTAEVESANGAFGGYLAGETEFNELTSGTKVTVEAVPYYGNTFAGWYDGNTLVSTDAKYEHTVTADTELVAKFNRNNLMKDSGFENTEVSTSVLGNGLDWSSTVSGVYGNVVNLNASTGTNGINIGGATDTDVKYSPVAVTANKTYHFAFHWLLSRSGSEYGLEYVKVYNAANNALIAELGATEAKEDQWQKAFINFNTGSATSIYFVIKYTGGAASIYIDDMVLFDTASAPFSIEAEMEMDDIYPGYLTSDAVQYVNYGSNATVSVSTYMANKFTGWYKDGKLVSTNETYTFEAEEFAKLVAKFEINNLITDSGYENSQVGLSLSDAGLWRVNESNKILWGFDVWYGKAPFTGNKANSAGSFTINAYDGENVIRAYHRNNNIATTLTGLKMNTNYVFTYYWQIQNLGDEAYLAATTLKGVQTGEELGAGRGVGIGAAATTEWQKVTIPFFSGQNTEVTLDIKYQAGSGDFFIDNMALYESDYITLIASEGGSIQTDFNGGVSGPAQRGDRIELKAIPDAGYEFMGWYDYTDSTKIFSKNTTYVFNANGAVAIAAYFKKIGSNEDPINYFVDGDFENNCLIPPTFDHANSSTDWCNYGVTTVSGEVTPYSGENFLRLEAHSRHTNFLISNLEPFTTYTVSMAYWVPEYVTFGSIAVYERRREHERIEPKEGLVFQVNKARHFGITDYVSDQCLGYIGIRDTDTVGKWETLEFTFTTNNRTEAYMAFNYSRPKGSNQLFLDDIQIRKTSSGYTNTLVNGDFGSENTSDAWLGDVNIANGAAAMADGDELYQNLILKRYTDYTVTFSAKGSAGSKLHYGMTRGGQELYNADGISNAFTYYAGGVAELTTDWKEYSLDITSTDILNFTLNFLAEGNGIEIDNVRFEATTSLKKVDKVGFDTAEGRVLRDLTIQTITTTFVKGSGEWQANYALNKKFYEIYEANGANDDKVHSGDGSLIMKKDPISALNATEQDAYSKTGAPFNQEFVNFQLQFGKTYELSYWVKADEANTSFKTMLVETDASWYLDDIVSEVVTAGTEWKKVTHKFVVGEGIVTGQGVIRLCFNRIDSNLKSDVYIDDIEVVQTASTVLVENEQNLYTQDISQNYLENYSFEKNEGPLGAYSKAAKDAVYGDKIGTFKAGDKVVIPVNTRTDYKQTFSETYTLAASLRGNASAKGGIYITIDEEGKDVLASFETDEIVKLSPNTNGKWVRSGFTFADERHTTLYLVIECTAGTFDVDYLEFFNADYGYKTVQYDEREITFDPNDPDNMVDPNSNAQGNYIAGNISGLPSGSKVVLVGNRTYSGTIADDGSYRIDNIANGKYNMFIAASDAEMMTLWGDISFKNTVLSGLACERLNGSVTVVSGQGVRNGIAKILDNETGWAYLTATNANGEYTAYIIDCLWSVEGTTNIPEALEASKVDIEQFNSGAATLAVAAVEPAAAGSAVSPIVCAIIMVIAAAALVVCRKKGVRA